MLDIAKGMAPKRTQGRYTPHRERRMENAKHQSVQEVREQRLSVGTKAIFGMGDYLNTVTYGMIAAFLMAFLTDTIMVVCILGHGPAQRAVGNMIGSKENHVQAVDSQLLFWLLTVLWLPAVNLLMSKGGLAQDKAYFTAAILFTLPGILFAFLLFKRAKEVVEPPKSTRMPVFSCPTSMVSSMQAYREAEIKPLRYPLIPAKR